MTIQMIKHKFLTQEVIEILSLSVYHPTPEKLQNRIQKYLKQPNIMIYGYYDVSELKGIIIIEQLNDEQLQIKDFAVATAYQKQNIGTQLLDMLIDTLNPTCLIATTDDDAMLFYKKYGFNITSLPHSRYLCTYDRRSEMKTARCNIQSVSLADTNDLIQLFTNPMVRKYLGGIKSEESCHTTIFEMLEDQPHHYWVVRRIDDDTFLGLVSIDEHHESDTKELSYQFMPHCWHQGYATEVLTYVVDYAFYTLKLPKLISETQSANIASCRLLLRLGMTFENEVIRFGEKQSIFSIEK